jgi:hypothetical protein
MQIHLNQNKKLKGKFGHILGIVGKPSMSEYKLMKVI